MHRNFGFPAFEHDHQHIRHRSPLLYPAVLFFDLDRPNSPRIVFVASGQELICQIEPIEGNKDDVQLIMPFEGGWDRPEFSEPINKRSV